MHIIVFMLLDLLLVYIRISDKTMGHIGSVTIRPLTHHRVYIVYSSIAPVDHLAQIIITGISPQTRTLSNREKKTCTEALYHIKLSHRTYANRDKQTGKIGPPTI